MYWIDKVNIELECNCIVMKLLMVGRDLDWNKMFYWARSWGKVRQASDGLGCTTRTNEPYRCQVYHDTTIYCPGLKEEFIVVSVCRVREHYYWTYDVETLWSGWSYLSISVYFITLMLEFVLSLPRILP